MIYEKNKLEMSDIKGLIFQSISAVVIRNFYPSDIAYKMAQKIMASPKRGYYNREGKLARIGMAHFEIDSAESNKKYHDFAIQRIQNLRSMFKPYLSPIDELRLMLEEIWPHGAVLQTLNGLKCFVGICRILDPMTVLKPHYDRLDRDYCTDTEKVQHLQGQLSANIYLQVPNKGGELELWMEDQSSKKIQDLNIDGYFGIAASKMPPPKFSIKPNPGDLIIFNTNLYHGIRSGEGSSRISIGSFIGYTGDQFPLTYWS